LVSLVLCRKELASGFLNESENFFTGLLRKSVVLPLRKYGTYPLLFDAFVGQHLLSYFLLALIASQATASDPSSLQDFCVADEIMHSPGMYEATSKLI
jgi:hypothetical protein